MSGSDDYFNTYHPDEHVLRFWIQKYHVEATVEDNRSSVGTQRLATQNVDTLDRFLASRSGIYDRHWTDIDIDDVEYSELNPSPRNLPPEVAEEFLVELRQNYSPYTQTSTFRKLKQAYSWCERAVHSVDINPFGQVEEKYKKTENDWILESPSGREPHIITIEEAREFIRNYNGLVYICGQLILAKYARRVGGVSNLDFADVHLDHPGCNWDVHQKLRRYPDHILFRSDKKQSEATRKSGNKTKTDATYPIDEELKQFLLAYLATRPQPDQDGPHPEPLLVGPEGPRLSGDNLTFTSVTNAKELGHYYGPNDDDNINGHYWRHWGTSWYEDHFGGNKDTLGNTALTDYIRGDSREEIKGLYDNYTEQKKVRILDAMPTFFERFVED